MVERREIDLEQDIVMGPMVQLVLEGYDDTPFPFSDLVRDGEAHDPGTIADATLFTLIARHFDRDVADLGNLQVTRPETGNLVLAPKPVYGEAK